MTSSSAFTVRAMYRNTLDRSARMACGFLRGSLCSQVDFFNLTKFVRLPLPHIND